MRALTKPSCVALQTGADQTVGGAAFVLGHGTQQPLHWLGQLHRLDAGPVRLQQSRPRA